MITDQKIIFEEKQTRSQYANNNKRKRKLKAFLGKRNLHCGLAHKKLGSPRP